MVGFDVTGSMWQVLGGEGSYNPDITIVSAFDVCLWFIYKASGMAGRQTGSQAPCC